MPGRLGKSADRDFRIRRTACSDDLRLLEASEEAVETSWQRVLRVASTQPLRDYIFARLLDMIGRWMLRFTNGWLVWDLTKDWSMVSWALLCLLLPGLVMEPVGGVVADRYDRRTVLGGTSVVAAGVTGMIGLLA